MMDSDSTHSTEVTIDAPGWRSAVTDPEALCHEIAAIALGRLLGAAGGSVELGIVLTDDATVRGLNRAWRRHDRPTNVLSFPSGIEPGEVPSGAPWLLGDVVLAFETVEREARAAGRPLRHHLAHLLVHGVLHLLGHDHEVEAEALGMEALEVELLAQLNIPDPYAEVVS
jgi:probable rRNA maturation factor